ICITTPSRKNQTPAPASASVRTAAPSPLPLRAKPTPKPQPKPKPKPQALPKAQPKATPKPQPKPQPQPKARKMSTGSPAPSSVAGRRSRRSVAQPVNYYAPPPGFHGYLGDDGESLAEPVVKEEFVAPAPVRPKKTQAAPKRPALVPNEVAQKKQRYPVLYSTPKAHIRREPLSGPDARDYLQKQRHEGKRRPYLPRAQRLGCKQLCLNLATSSAPEEGTILHCDFDYEEMKGIYDLAMDGESPAMNINDAEVLCQQLSLKLRRTCLADDEVASLAHRIARLNTLRKALAKTEKTLTLCRDQFLDNDFSTNARKTVLECLKELGVGNGSGGPEVGIYQALNTVDPEYIDKLQLMYPLTRALRYRNKFSILRDFILDARHGDLKAAPTLIRGLPGPVPKTESLSGCAHQDVQSLIRNRELGCPVRLERPRPNTALDRKQAQLRPWKHWKGFSNDATHMAWSPDGTRFIAGSTTLCDPHNMQYNRDKNLLLGDMINGRLKELPEHRIPKPASNRNPSTPDNIYMTITQTRWWENYAYTSSYDKTVKVWDLSDFENPYCVRTLRHNTPVAAMDVSTLGTLATGVNESGFFLWPGGQDESSFHLPLVKGNANTSLDMATTALHWGKHLTSDYLAGGLSGKDAIGTFDPPKDGRLLLWKMRNEGPALEMVRAMNVFDIAWHDELAVLAAASAPTSGDNGVGRDTRSVIRLYEPLTTNFTIVEYLCPALDINEINFCPTNRNYIAASCTDGATYVFDHRNPRSPLHTLVHGDPISKQWPGYDQGATREQGDVGVTFADWKTTDELYSASTDGVVKKWDILRAPEDVLTEDVISLNVEVSCGSFSPDYTNLLLGDATGGLHAYTCAPCAGHADERDTFTFDRGTSGEDDGQGESGVEIAREALSSKELIRHSIIGVVQGPAYGKGPTTKNLYAQWARPDKTSKHALAHTGLRPEIQARQLLCPNYNVLSPEDRKYIDAQIQLGLYRNRSQDANNGKLSELLPQQPFFDTTSAPNGEGPATSGLFHGLPAFNVEDSDDDIVSPVTARSNFSDALPSSAKRPEPASHIKMESSPAVQQNLHCAYIDLTGDEPEEIQPVAPPVHDLTSDVSMAGDETSVMSVDQQWDEELLERLEEDNWWPNPGINV
ncbi:hypothetical protein KEM55_004486, partial [Ascosphaera atra]